jgi:predicted ATPase
VRYEDKKRFLGSVNKELEIISSTKNNKSFLMDLVLDFRHGSQNAVDQNTWNNINRILQAIKKRKDIRFGIGPRGRYRVGIVQDREDQSVVQILPSIDNLSLGESVLLNLFINIIRHGDNPPKATTDIQGIVVIDEIDVHLHTDLQNSVLPELIKLFPKVQFIITTHSPLFLLGMKEIFGEEGFEVRNMPKGEIITTERFSEFEHAYEALQKTKTFEDRINEQIATSIKPILFVEGDYDTSYLNAAGRLLRRMDLLEKIEIRDVNGSGGLDSIWRSFNHKKLSEIIPQKIILLYDCDTKKQDDSKGRVFKRIIPTVQDGILEKGIENLFDKVILRKAILNKKEYVDITPTFTKTIRGNDIVMPEKWEINEDEKGNLCDWICENGTEDDFNYFKKIFEIIETVINTQV